MKKVSNDYPIDFVIIWVDGSDEKWRAEKAKYSGEDKRESKYRDWDLLKYWFRGVEKFAPWVNKVHFVTCGHLPSWINTDCPKLNIVKHSDYIPKKYLPTFSSHPIELNLHRIPGLAEHFSYFNDDMYLIRAVNPEDFFKDGAPRDRAVLTVNCVKESWEIQHINNQDTSVINEEFDFKKCIAENHKKWFSFKNGKDIIRNLWLLPCPRFPGFKHEHANSNFLKSTFEEVWSKYYNVMDRTSLNKFRTHLDVNQWVFKDWQIAKGNIEPVSTQSHFVDLKYNNKLDEACYYIEKQKTNVLCINDAENIDEDTYIKMKTALAKSFDRILSEKSCYEK